MKKRDILVLVCNAHYFGEGYHAWDAVEDCNGQSLRCRFTNDLSAVERADALWFHAPTLRWLPRKRPGQKWVLMSMESEANYPMLQNGRFLRLFDILMTYRLDSDVPVVYPSWTEYGMFREPPRPIAKKRPAALYVQSHGVAYRDRYVRRLMKHFTVDAPGKCLNNTTFERLLGGNPPRGDPAIAAMRWHKFALAFENSRATDYVTERLFRALAVGSVPVYWGAYNVSEFLPAPDAAIRVDDFGSPRELARHLERLDRDDAAYAAHLAWKARPFAPRFVQILELSRRAARLRLCVKLAHGCDGDCGCGGRLSERRPL